MFSIVDVYRNRDQYKLKLTLEERGVLDFFLEVWNKAGRQTNKITPRTKFATEQLDISEKRFYKYRKQLAKKGIIKVTCGGFNKKGKQNPAIISLADWLVKTDKVTVKTDAEKSIERPSTDLRINNQSKQTPRTLVATDLNDYGKDLLVQIGGESITAFQLKKIKMIETEFSDEVIKEVRGYVHDNSKSNPVTYYIKIMTDLFNHNLLDANKLHKSNTVFGQMNITYVTTIAPKTHKTTNTKTSHTRYIRGKRVEKGVDWEKKYAEIQSKKRAEQRSYDAIHGAGAWDNDAEKETEDIKAWLKRFEKENNMA